MDILKKIVEAGPQIIAFRSGGFLNKDPDMGRIYVDLPIVEAKKLLLALNGLETIETPNEP